jgi:predicted permease
VHGSLDLSPDWRMLGFALGVAVLTGVLFGLVPALRLSRGEFRVSAKASAAGGRSRLNQGLVVAQIALSVALLATAGLFVRSLQNLRTADLGFRPDNVVRFSLEFGRDYDVRQRADVHRRVMEKVAALPDVRSATVSGAGLFGGDGFVERFGVDGHAPEAGEDLALVVVAGPDFFDTLGIPLRAGRGFTWNDEVGAPATGESFPRVAVIGETLARRYYGNADPIGRMLRFGPGSSRPPLEIIGVAKDVKYRTLREKTEPQIYVPYFGGVMSLPMVVQAATRGEPRALERSIGALVRDVDPRVVVADFGTMRDLVNNSLIQERMVAQFGGFFSVFALVLASLGLYGVLSYGIVQRTREIGVRMALGATVRDVLGLVVGQGVRLALIGVGLGVSVALAATQLVTKLLYGVTPNDPVTFGGVVILFLVVAAFAAWLPARRAAKVDPMVALRVE